MGGLVQIFKLTPVYLSYRDKTRSPYFLAYKNPVSNFMKLVLTIQVRNEKVWRTYGKYVLLDQVLSQYVRTCDRGRVLLIP